MRVYELSKILDMSNKELLEMLALEGYDVKSHMSILPDDAQAAIEKRIKAQKKPSAEEKKPVVTEKIVLQQPTVPEKKEAPVAKNSDLKEKIINKQPVLQQESFRPVVASAAGIPIESMSLEKFAELAQLPASEIIVTLLRQGIVCAKNQALSQAAVKMLVGQLGLTPLEKTGRAHVAGTRLVKNVDGGKRRQPVVVIVGHVDHGKTTLLDYIRNTRVAAREKGGITQHLGAYQVETKHGGVVFLDTPGHEAFSNIRGRGIKVADIAVVIIAADDGIMPQTLEAIKLAKDMEVPIVVAINKIDKANPTVVASIKRNLADLDLLPEEWGGQTVVAEISAQFGTGVDELLEVLALQAEVMDLFADPAQSALGFVLESKLEKGRGPVATVICQNGTLHVGDFFSSGQTHGRVSSILDTFGKSIKSAGPSIPVRVAGFSELPQAGDYFEVVSAEQYKKIKGARTAQVKQQYQETSEKDTVPVVLKVDNASTREAVVAALNKISARSKKRIVILYEAVGDIIESDVTMATDTGAHLIGLHVKVESKAATLAQKNKISIHQYDIIYKLLEDLEALASHEEAKMVRQKVGEAEVRKVFAIKDLGVIAGSYVKDGRFVRNGSIVAYRGNEKIGEGPIKSLQRDKKTVKEVHAGFEFAFLVDSIDDWQVGDRVECYIEALEKKTL